MADSASAQNSMADHTHCQAAINAIYEAAVEVMEDPPKVGTQRFWFDSRLGTAGHAYHKQGWAETIAENGRLREALEEIASRPTVERNPDGDDQAAHTMQMIAREALNG